MKKLRKLTRIQKQLLINNGFNHEIYLVERTLGEGTMFVDRLKTHRLYHCRRENKFYRLGV